MTTTHAGRHVAAWQWALYTVIALIPTALTLTAIPHMSSRIITHWNVRGRPDGWGPPATALTLPAIGIGMAILMAVLTIWLSDDRPGVTQRSMFYTGLVAVSVWVVMVAVSDAQDMGTQIPGLRTGQSTVIADCVAVLMAALGMACPAAPPNGLFGFRTPAAQADPRVWFRTQVVGGRLMVASGVVTLIVGFVAPSASMPVLVILLLVSVAIAWVYSEYIIRRPQPAGPSDPGHGRA